MIKKYFLLSFIFCALTGTIYETKQVTDVLHYVEKFGTKNTLVVFDLDNTLIEAEDEMVRPQAFDVKKRHFQIQGFTVKEAIKRFIHQFTDALEKTPMHPVEKNTIPVLEKLRKLEVPVLVLTASRPIELTRKNLAKAHIDLENPLRWSDCCYIFKDQYLDDTAYYTPGILFAWDSDKGQVLELFLKKVNFIPDTLIFVDDKEDEVKSVEKMTLRLKIQNSVLLRYGYLDDHVAQFHAHVHDNPSFKQKLLA